MAYTAAPRAGGGWQPVWSWNETDVTQFTRVVGTGALTYRAASFTPITSQDQTAASLPCMRMDADGSAARTLWTINDFTPVTGRYVLTCLADSEIGFGLLLYYQDATHWVSIESTATGNFPTRNNAGAIEVGVHGSNNSRRPTMEIIANMGSAECMFKRTSGMYDMAVADNDDTYLERAADWTGAPALSGWTGAFNSLGIMLAADITTRTRDLSMVQIWSQYADGAFG